MSGVEWSERTSEGVSEGGELLVASLLLVDVSCAVSCSAGSRRDDVEEAGGRRGGDRGGGRRNVWQMTRSIKVTHRTNMWGIKGVSRGNSTHICRSPFKGSQQLV